MTTTVEVRVYAYGPGDIRMGSGFCESNSHEDPVPATYWAAFGRKRGDIVVDLCDECAAELVGQAVVL